MDLAMRYFRVPFKGWLLRAIGIAVILSIIMKLDKLIGLMEASKKAAAISASSEMTETLGEIVNDVQKPKKKEKKGYPKKK